MEVFKGILGLFESRKAVSVYIVLGLMTYLVIVGILPPEVFAILVGVIKVAWLAAHSHEESSKAKAEKTFDSAQKMIEVLLMDREKLRFLLKEKDTKVVVDGTTVAEAAEAAAPVDTEERAD